MTRLHTSPAPRRTVPTEDRRPLAIAAATAGLVASGGLLATCMAIGLAGWLASDAGGNGDTGDAIRVGADAWLLAHGSYLELTSATVSLAPLGLTLLCGYVVFRLGRWAAATSDVEDVRGALTGATILAGVYGVVSVLTAVLASVEPAQPHLGRAFAGGFALALLGGGAGIASGSRAASPWLDRAPESVLVVVRAALSVVLLMLAAGSVLVCVALFADFGSAANVLSRLHTDVPGGLLYTLVVAAVVPNAALLGGAYLLGPGFAVGTGTLVSPSVVVLGPVPAFPLLAALPDGGPVPVWARSLVAVPAVLAALGVALTLRRHPAGGYQAAAVRGAAAGMLAGVAVAGLTALAGGSVGPGRMADVGARAGGVLLVATVSLGLGGLTGALAATRWPRR